MTTGNYDYNYMYNEQWQEIVRWNSSDRDGQVECTSMAFDSVHEQVWSGFSNGRITSHHVPSMSKYSSVLSNLNSIVQLIPCYDGVIALSQYSAVLRSRGCVHSGSFAVSDKIGLISCGKLNNLDLNSPEYVIIGGDKGMLCAFSLYLPNKSVWSLDLHHPVTKMSSCEDNTLMACGLKTGKVDFFDGSMRSNRVELSLNCHSGEIVSMDMSGNYLITCGVNSRSVNPFDKKAPVKVYPDPLVKVFDIRMMQQLTSTLFPSSCTLPPKFVKFAPGVDGTTYYVADVNGEMISFDLAMDSNLSTTQYNMVQTYQVLTRNEGLNCMEMSCSGNYFAFGHGDGSLGLYCNQNLSSNPKVQSANHENHTIESLYPSTNNRKNQSAMFVSPLELSPASKYLFRPNKTECKNAAGVPFSSWLPTLSSTLKNQITLVVAPKPIRVIHPEFEAKITQKESIGYTSHKGFDPNSFLYGKGQTKVFHTIDPRFKTPDSSASGASKQYAAVRGSTQSFDESDPNHVPQRYKHNKITVTKRGSFDFGWYNTTDFVGLENNLPYSYMNSVLQLLFFIPEIRVALIQHLCIDSNAEKDICLCCELGFLYHMMEQINASNSPYTKSCQATNFLSALRQIPEAVALGLFDKNTTITRRVEIFVRFILQYIESRINTKTTEGLQMKSALTISLRKRSRCDSDHIIEHGTSMHVVELIYPEIWEKNRTTPILFSNILVTSLYKEIKTKAWCKECDQYTDICQKCKCISLPQILVIQCNVFTDHSSHLRTSSKTPSSAAAATTTNNSNHHKASNSKKHFDAKNTVKTIATGNITDPNIDALWHSKNAFGGSWVPSHLRIKLKQNSVATADIPEGDSEVENTLLVSERVDPEQLVPPNEQTSQSEEEVMESQNSIHEWANDHFNELAEQDEYVLIGAVAAVIPDRLASQAVSGPQAHLIAHTNISHTASSIKYDSNWILFNDFSATKTILFDAVAFHPPWKYPCTLIYRRKESVYTSTCTSATTTTIGACNSNSTANMEPGNATQPPSTLVQNPNHIPFSVFHAPSLSKFYNANIDTIAKSFQMAATEEDLPLRGERIAIDTEFVTVEMEQATLQADGTRVVTKESRNALARVSAIHGETGVVFIDDYVIPNEPVVDYNTRFSGLTAEDLNPSLSRHYLVSLKTAYMKLRYLVDRGCVFVGHGLYTDFRIVNIFVPPQQMIDTVEIYRRPDTRMIALRFLTAFLFNSHIQMETNDSIEDARAALSLHDKYKELKENGEFETALNAIYNAGFECRFKVADLKTTYGNF